MSSFAINGRIVFDPCEGATALAHATPFDATAGDRGETRTRSVREAMDPRLLVLELVAALALEISARGDHVARLDVE